MALGEVEKSLLGFAKESERQQSLNITMQQYKKVLDIAQLQYQEGIIAQLDVLQAQQNVYDSTLAYAASSAESSYQLIALQKSFGAGVGRQPPELNSNTETNVSKTHDD
jgi:outer membrane protein TolC